MQPALSTLALFGNLGTMELLIILAIGLLLFGRRLPEVGKSLGKGIVEFKRGLKGIEEEVEERSTTNPGRSSQQRLPSSNENEGTDTDSRRVSRADTVESKQD